MQIFAIIVALVLAYLIGSLSGSLLLGRFFGQTDVRDSGSGNAGATNALRTGGRSYGMAVLLFDVVKGMLVAGLLPALLQLAGDWAYACGLLVVLGHVYPLFHGFRGGKGAATGIGVLLVLLPLPLLIGALVWGAVLVASGYVGLATVLGVVAVALASFAVVGVSAAGHAFVLALGVLIVHTHRGNIQRLLAGTENRFDRARIWRRR